MRNESNHPIVMTKHEAAEIAKPFHAPIYECFTTGVAGWIQHSQLLSNQHPFLSASTRGSYIHDLAVQHAKKVVVEAGATHSVVQQVDLFDLGRGLILRFKQPGTPETDNAKGLANQLYLIPELASLNGSTTVVQAEHSLDESGFQILKAKLACMIENKREWAISILESVTVSKIPISPDADAQRRKTTVRSASNEVAEGSG